MSSSPAACDLRMLADGRALDPGGLITRRHERSLIASIEQPACNSIGQPTLTRWRAIAMSTSAPMADAAVALR